MPIDSPLPSGTVTFLFTDVEGSTRLLKQLGEPYGEVLSAHQRILRAAFARSDGQEIDTQGDSFFVAFSRAKDALAAAVDGQRMLAAHGWPDGVDFRVRMGVHTGEPTVGTGRYVGLGVHRAARIMAAGHGGQILVSNATRELLEDDLAAGMSLRDLDEHRLKDLDRPERLFQVVADGLESEFPPLRTEDAPTAYTGLEDELAVAASAAITGRSRRRRRFVTALAIAFVISLAAIAAVALRGGDSLATEPADPPAAVALDEANGNVVASVSVDSGPGRATVGGGALWVANTDAGTVSRIDPVKRDVSGMVPVGSGPTGVAFGDGSLWVVNGADGTLMRISANRVVKVIRMRPGPRGIAYGEGAAWVANLDDRSVSRVDPVTNSVSRPIPTAGTPTAIAVGAGSVWVTDETGSSVSRIDPRTKSVTGTFNVGNGPVALAVGFGSVWVANTLDGTVSRLDPETGNQRGLVSVGVGPRDIAVGRRWVWVANESSGTISKIDPRTNAVVSSPVVGGRPTGLVVSGGAVWVTVRPTVGAHRGGTFTWGARELPLNPIDSALAYNDASWPMLSLTGDGLTAFRRVGGAEGATVVPDLAIALPAPTDGGKTYTFRLRRGIRYSTGALVRPQDVRLALERVFELRSDGRQFYSGLVGAASCDKGRPCDLSRGIVVRGDTITFHLVAAEPEFPQRLALPFAFVVPATTPRKVTGNRPLPATGPYVIVHYDPKRRVVLKRNPHFHEWSRAARPDGNPDSIVLTLGLSDSAATTAVERGRLDFAPVVPPKRIDELSTRHSSQLHASPYPSTGYLLLNLRVPPFDSLDARRALAYALDRAKLIRLGGFAAYQRPTCQILPPNFPGHEPYCPYVPAPDLAKARKLVARSGTAGARVNLRSPKGFPAAEDYVLDVLTSLGYKATRKGLSLAALVNLNPLPPSVQVVDTSWVSDYPSASAFVQSTLSCDGAANAGGFCDRSLDAKMHRAQLLGLTDPRAANAEWASIDHELVDAAPWIPYWYGRVLSFVSTRVGNFQFSPQWQILFDQLWVR